MRQSSQTLSDTPGGGFAVGEKKPFFVVVVGLKEGLGETGRPRHKWVAFKKSLQFSSRELFWLYSGHDWD